MDLADIGFNSMVDEARIRKWWKGGHLRRGEVR
jgi:hypothetical protein